MAREGRSLRGIVVTNGYVKSKKFDEVTALYLEAARQFEMELEHVTTKELMCGIEKDQVIFSGCDLERLDFVIFLDKDIRLARVMERLGVRVFNSAHVIEVCDDKAATFFELVGSGIKMPKTIAAPLVFPGTYGEGQEDDFVGMLEQEIGYPMVVKECFGSFGEQVYLVENEQQLREKRKAIASVPHIYQAFIKSSYGKDVRVHVVGEKVVASMLRVSKSDFRANISSGGRMEQISLPKAFEELAIKTAKVLKADFVGVDLLFGEDGEPVLCEVNSNAHIKNILVCTGINVAEQIMEHIEKELGHE